MNYLEQSVTVLEMPIAFKMMMTIIKLSLNYWLLLLINSCYYYYPATRIGTRNIKNKKDVTLVLSEFYWRTN